MVLAGPRTCRILVTNCPAAISPPSIPIVQRGLDNPSNGTGCQCGYGSHDSYGARIWIRGAQKDHQTSGKKVLHNAASDQGRVIERIKCHYSVQMSATCTIEIIFSRFLVPYRSFRWLRLPPLELRTVFCPPLILTAHKSPRRP